MTERCKSNPCCGNPAFCTELPSRRQTAHQPDPRGNRLPDEAAAEIARLREALKAKERECAEWQDIAECMTDPDPCHFDHHGYCQAHGWLCTDPKCPHERAKIALRASNGDTTDA